MKMNKLLCAISATAILLAGCSAPSEATSQSTANTSNAEETSTKKGTKIDAETVDAMSDEELYWATRNAVLYHAAYTRESMQPLFYAWLEFDLTPTIDEVLEKIANPDADTKKALENLREAYKGLVQTAEYSDVTFDIWEGHDAIPVPGDEDPNHYSDSLACLADDDDFRPFISDYRLDDPSSAKGTLIAIPSIRGGYTELAEIADVFNEMGYNVFTVEPRMDTVGDLGYAMLNMDVQRSIRYVRYHADELGIDSTNIFTLAGSKGNFSHPLSFNYYDTNPTEYVKELGSTMKNYKPDEIDEEYSNVALMCVDYGTAGLAGFGNKFTEKVITDSKIYSEENYENGLKFPDVLIMTGNLDGDTLNDPAVIEGLYNYNKLEDKLYTVNYEVHILNNVAHGFGAGSQYQNLTTQWQEVGVFIDSCLNPQTK